MPIRRILAVVSLAALVAACGGIVDPSKNAVDTPSGTIPVGGVADPFSFSVGKTGEFFVTITSLTPDPNIVVGMALGQPQTGGCAPFPYYINNVAQLNRQALGGQIDKGDYCISMYDVGLLKQPASFTLRVSHP
jgi:hypothetical protein